MGFVIKELAHGCLENQGSKPAEGLMLLRSCLVRQASLFWGYRPVKPRGRPSVRAGRRAGQALASRPAPRRGCFDASSLDLDHLAHRPDSVTPRLTDGMGGPASRASLQSPSNDRA